MAKSSNNERTTATPLIGLTRTQMGHLSSKLQFAHFAAFGRFGLQAEPAAIAASALAPGLIGRARPIPGIGPAVRVLQARFPGIRCEREIQALSNSHVEDPADLSCGCSDVNF